jgi:uncharacterized membrane protein HdeD (DUF308 family)
MELVSSTIPPSDLRRPSRAWRLVVAGYSTAAAGLVAFLTINGGSGTPLAATISAAVLIIVGLFLPAAGILQLRRSLGRTENAARHGYAMQSFGLLGLLFGVVFVVEVASLSGFFISAGFVVASGVSAIAGAALLRRHHAGAPEANTRGVTYLILGTVAIFSGVGLIVGSNIAFEYLLSQVEETIYVDIGATLSACGCVLSAYSFFVLHDCN